MVDQSTLLLATKLGISANLFQHEDKFLAARGKSCQQLSEGGRVRMRKNEEDEEAVMRITSLCISYMFTSKLDDMLIEIHMRRNAEQAQQAERSNQLDLCNIPKFLSVSKGSSPQSAAERGRNSLHDFCSRESHLITFKNQIWETASQSHTEDAHVRERKEVGGRTRDGGRLGNTTHVALKFAFRAAAEMK